MTKRDEEIKKYGIEIVEDDEKTWQKRGYTIDYNTGLLVKIERNKNEKSTIDGYMEAGND